MIKRKAAYALVGGLLVAGLVFNAPTMATYVEKLGTATQTINAATWDVQFEDHEDDATIFPGDEISQDTITLKNGNNYPVMYTINLTETGPALKDKLTLDLLRSGSSTGIKSSNNSIKVLVDPNETVVLTSKVTWTPSEEDYTYQGQSVTYNYDIEAKSMADSIKGDKPQQGVEVITASSEEAIEVLVEKIIKENPEAVIEDVKEVGEYCEYTIRVPKQSTTFDYKTDKYDYIVVKVPKDLKNVEALQNMNRTIFKVTSAYRATKDQKLHVHFKLNESINLDNKNDNVEILYLNEKGYSIESKSKSYCGYINQNVNGENVKYSKGVHIIDKCDDAISNDLQPGEYSTTAKANDKVKAIKVRITKDGVKYEETWNL